MNSTYEIILKNGPKVKMENFWATKSWRNFLEGLKQKVDIFIGLKKYLTLFFNKLVVTICIVLLCINDKFLQKCINDKYLSMFFIFIVK